MFRVGKLPQRLSSIAVLSTASLLLTASASASTPQTVSPISGATQFSAVYNIYTSTQCLYFLDANHQINEIRTNSTGQVSIAYNVTKTYGLPAVNSPTISAVYDATTHQNLIFYLSGSSTANVIEVSENI